ncbi:MAG: TetR/AcrR family transcriptional regulator [Anaerolineae bacterium]
MAKSTARKRKYDSTRRQSQARETRTRILKAAETLFMEHGYAGATIEAIAARADVASETVYASFKNKRRIVLELLTVLAAGGVEEDVPITRRAGPRAVAQEHDQRRQLAIFAETVAHNLERVAWMSELLTIAARAQQDVDRMMQRLNEQRWQHMAVFVEQLAVNGPLRDRMNRAEATDIVWTLASPEVFLLTTRDRTWSTERYTRWLADALARMLLPD